MDETACTTWVVRFIRIYSPVRSPWSYASKDPALLERRALCNYKKVRPPFASPCPFSPTLSPLSTFVFFLPSSSFCLSFSVFPSWRQAQSEQLLEDGKPFGIRRRKRRKGWEGIKGRKGCWTSSPVPSSLSVWAGRAGFLITRLTNERNSLLSNREDARWYPCD